MASIITLGLASITIGEIANDGGPGTTLAAYGYTFQGSAKMTQDDPEVNEFFAEESEDPILRKPKKGRTTFSFQLMDPDAETLQKVFGGTVTGTTPKAWNAPVVSPVIERTVKITPEQGLIITIPRGSVSGKMEGEFTRTGLFMVTVMVVPLTPKKTGVAPIIATEPAA